MCALCVHCVRKPGVRNDGMLVQLGVWLSFVSALLLWCCGFSSPGLAALLKLTCSLIANHGSHSHFYSYDVD